MKTVKTNPSTLKTLSSGKLTSLGNAGNTKGTRLPGGGCQRSKGKRRKGY